MEEMKRRMMLLVVGTAIMVLTALSASPAFAQQNSRCHFPFGLGSLCGESHTGGGGTGAELSKKGVTTSSSPDSFQQED
jgi:hypothetical protein